MYWSYPSLSAGTGLHYRTPSQATSMSTASFRTALETLEDRVNDIDSADDMSFVSFASTSRQDLRETRIDNCDTETKVIHPDISSPHSESEKIYTVRWIRTSDARPAAELDSLDPHGLKRISALTTGGHRGEHGTPQAGRITSIVTVHQAPPRENGTALGIKRLSRNSDGKESVVARNEAKIKMDNLHCRRTKEMLNTSL